MAVRLDCRGGVFAWFLWGVNAEKIEDADDEADVRGTIIALVQTPACARVRRQ